MVDLRPVRRIILVQVVVALIIALGMLFFQGLNAAISSFVGGAIGFSTSFIYARKMLARPGSEAKKLVHSHYTAEAYKLAFTILLFSLVFSQYKDVHALALIGTYAATLAVYWVALIIV